MTQTIAFLVILATSVAALFGVHWTICVASGLILALISLYEHRQYRARFAAVGMTEVFQSFAFSNAGVGLVAATLAFGLGTSVRFFVFA